MNPMQFFKVVIFVLAQRGGVGKSFLAQLLNAMLQLLRLRTIMLDADRGNSSTANLFPDARMVDLESPLARGTLLRALKEVGQGLADAAILDVAAGRQKSVMDLLPRLCAEAKALDVRMVWVAPFTGDNYSQVEAVKAVESAKRHGIALVWARQLGQGHEENDYRTWEKSKSRAAGLSYAVECKIPNASRYLVDNACSLHLSVRDVGMGIFDRLNSDHRALAEQLFDDDTRTFALDYLAETSDLLGIAVAEALDRAAAYRNAGGPRDNAGAM